MDNAPRPVDQITLLVPYSTLTSLCSTLSRPINKLPNSGVTTSLAFSLQDRTRVEITAFHPSATAQQRHAHRYGTCKEHGIVDWGLQVRGEGHFEDLRERLRDFGTGVVYLDPGVLPEKDVMDGHGSDDSDEAEQGQPVEGPPHRDSGERQQTAGPHGSLVSYPEHGGHLDWEVEQEVYPGEVPILILGDTRDDQGQSPELAGSLPFTMSSIQVGLWSSPSRSGSDLRPAFLRETYAALFGAALGDNDDGLFERRTRGHMEEKWDWDIPKANGDSIRVSLKLVEDASSENKSRVDDLDIRVTLGSEDGDIVLGAESGESGLHKFLKSIKQALEESSEE